jgi:hypothetical protein
LRKNTAVHHSKNCALMSQMGKRIDTPKFVGTGTRLRR